MQAGNTKRADHLRRLTVYVDGEDGEFFWVLIESTGDAVVWTDVEVFGFGGRSYAKK